MDLWSFTWMMMSCFSVAFSLEVTVNGSQLMLCDEDDHVCVSDPADCSPPTSSSVQQTLNMSCYYQNADRTGSMTCGWTPESSTESRVSLIFTSRNTVSSCQSIFNPAATLNVTARIRNHVTRTEIWSQPHSVFLYYAFKPFQPVLTVLGSTEDSVVLSWRSSIPGSCWLRYRPTSTSTWTQVQDSIPVHVHYQMIKYSIGELQPFTVYRAAVACRGKFSWMSDWSADVTAETLDRVPSRPSNMCYRLEETGPGGSTRLHLMWKPLDPESRILGYEVTVSPGGKMENVTEATVLLVVEEGNCTVSIRAFSAASMGPAAQLRINTHTKTTLPSIRNLWISSCFPGNKTLQVQWMLPSAPPSAPPLSHVIVRWRSETSLSSSRWFRVGNVTASSVAVPDLDPDESYMVSVFPLYSRQTGPPQTLSASLQQGALMEAVSLKVINVTKTTVTIMWAWQRKSGPIRVDVYSVMLRGDSDRRSVSLWPDQSQHTFSGLTPYTEYSLLLLADEVSRNILTVATEFDEVPTVAAVIPLLLLSVTVMTISILSRTIYKSYFFPPISSPKGSLAGRWLMDPSRQDSAEPQILDLEDFQVLGEKSLIILHPTDPLSSEEDLREDTSSLSVSSIMVQMSIIRLDTVRVCEAPPITEQDSEMSRQAVNVLNQREANGYFPQKGEDACQVSQRSETSEDILDGSVYQMTFLRKLEAGSSYLMCEDEYLSNSCCTAQTTEEEKAVSTA